ncbi:unnamed protein product, partial [Protopolystoma xenopodis]
TATFSPLTFNIFFPLASLAPQIIKYISEAYSHSQADICRSFVEKLSRLRSVALGKLGDKHDATIEVLCQYHDLLMMLEGRIPMTENGVRIDFKWGNAFGKDTMFVKYSTSNLTSHNVPRNCV